MGLSDEGDYPKVSAWGEGENDHQSESEGVRWWELGGERERRDCLFTQKPNEASAMSGAAIEGIAR